MSLSLPLRLREASSTSHRPPGSYEDAEEPLLERNSAPIALGSVPQTRPRSKSKPDSIFIHPRFNNIARADAAALELCRRRAEGRPVYCLPEADEEVDNRASIGRMAAHFASARRPL